MKKIFTVLFVSMAVFCGAQSKTLVITEVYGGGGNASSSYKNDYIQLFNLSSSPIDLAGYTLQIAPASGNLWETISLSGIVPPNHWYLVKGIGDGSYGADLPAADASGTFNINTESGKIALLNSNKPLADNCVLSTENIVDFIGYGKDIDCFETSAAPAHSITLATSRINFATDADNNATDFTVFPPNPKNTSEISLPVTLNVFSVNKIDRGNNIHWRVNCLSTSVTFEIERSTIPQNFTSIYSSVETKVRCAAPFDVKDNNPQNGENYYRLKIIDVDGHVSYSKISHSINEIKEAAYLKITPNIVSSFAELHYGSDKRQNIQIHVLDLQGRVVRQLSFEAVAGDNKIPVETSGFSRGQYHAFIFANGEKNASARFVKQ